jgi:soluble lytic murein transglycosylase
VNTAIQRGTARSRADRARIAAARRRRATRRRRTVFLIGFAALCVVLATVVLPRLPNAVRELTLPLKHEDIIRQQAAEKDLPPDLLAAVIFAESHFRDQTSHAGARGLMQITPATARYIAHLSGGTRFEQGDLSTPQINIAYGAFYLRYLMRRYDNHQVPALAAYNGGEGNVDRWMSAAGTSDRSFTTADIPFAETRDYVDRVISARADYRRKYASELGL